MTAVKCVQLRIAEINVDDDIQARVAISDEVVAEYAEALKADEGQANWPPIVVFKEMAPPQLNLPFSVKYWLADGFHRVLAAKASGIETLLAEVRMGTRADAKWYALGANKTHGLRRTHADKRKAVELALRMHPDYSDEKIAKHVGVHRQTVLAIRHEVVENRQPDTSLQLRLGMDGKRYPPPPPRPVPPARQPLPPMPGETDGETPAPGWKPPLPRALGELTDNERHIDDKPAKVLDAVGREVPQEKRELWQRRQETQDLLTLLSRVRGAVRQYQDRSDPLFAQVNYSSLMAHLDQAYADLEVGKPYAVCPSCQGLLGCRLCGGSGLLSKFRWDTCVSREQKEAVAGGQEA